MNNNSFKNIFLIWISLIFIILVLIFINKPGLDYEYTGRIVVSIHAVITVLIIGSFSPKYRNIFLLAFLLRLSLMLWDLYARHIFGLMHSGMDTETFYNLALHVYKGTELSAGRPIGIYSKILGYLFMFTGPIRIFAQYINVLFGMMVIMTINEILNLLRINEKAKKTSITIAAFFPTSLIMSSILLREIMPTFFVAISLYYLMRWYKNASGWNYIIFSIIFLGIAAMFHSGVIGLIIGYVFVFMFYDIKSNTLAMKPRSIAMFAGLALFLLLFIFQFGDALFYKFNSVEDMDDLYDTAMSARGGSAYLSGLQTNNPIQFLLYAPIRAFFFLYSPLPMNWRGASDIIGFVIDALFYIWVTYYYFKNRKYFKGNPLIAALIVAIIGAALIYGIGVGNAGTAMRHRQKLIPVFVTMVATMMNLKNRRLKFKK